MGFWTAFLRVKEQLESALAEAYSQHPGDALYITGHSLGGALAVIATGCLGSDSTGACYTFGAPRATDDAFLEPIKTPIYRVVNGADGVNHLPPGAWFDLVLALIRLIPINGTKWLSEQLRKAWVGYAHAGHLMFLTAGERVEVLASPDIFRQTVIVWKRLMATRFKALVTDHDMGDYAQKLLVYARKRNA